MAATSTSSKARSVPALVVSARASAWQSCRVITPNLERAYRDELGDDVTWHSLTQEMVDEERSQRGAPLWKLAEEIDRANPSRLVFLDHAPHPYLLLRALKHQRGKRRLPPIYHHVYGDFSYYSNHWVPTEPLLKNEQVRLICASERQGDFVGRLLASDNGVVARCHFPLDPQVFRHDPALRREWRARLGVAPDSNDELLVVYTGRLSLQKNITLLTEEIMNFADREGLRLRLALAGGFDDLGAPFFNVNATRGYYYQSWRRALAKLPARLRSKVEYLGQLGATDLVGLYNAADLYSSLSLHHDEDYGMSPAESLACGTPVILSDWGGYASFKIDDAPEGSCRLARVRIGERGLHIRLAEFRRALEAWATQARSEGDAERRARAKFHQARLGIDAARTKIREIHARLPPAFKGFNWKMKRHAEMLHSKRLFPDGPRKHTFYEEIYGAYASPPKETR